MTLVEPLLAQAERTPEAVAVRHGDEMTYAELVRRARALAGCLGDPLVGVLLDRGADAVVALHAVLLAGGAYVPLDPTNPPARNAAIVQDAGIRTVVVAKDQAARAAALGRLVPVRFVDAGDSGDPRVAPGAGEAPAYVLYTSGSTGRPKGVVLSHRAGRAFADWAAATFLGPGDRVSGVSPLAFDLSTLEIFATLAAGGTISIAPRALTAFPGRFGAWLAEEQVTCWYSVPSVVRRLLDAPIELPRLHRVLFAGEPFPPAQLAALMRAVPDARFANLYGPTETNVCAWHEVGGPPDGPVPIGVPAAGDRLREVDGVLEVAGPTLFSGYLGGEPIGEWYRTGDRVRFDGVWHYLGRADSMLKVRGFRVQPEEVEAAITAHPRVTEARVSGVETPEGKRLHAEVAGDLTPDEVRAWVATRVPAFMVPDTVHVGGALERGERGKLVR